jgi:hypothetical protein
MIDWIFAIACNILLAGLCFGAFCFDTWRDLKSYWAQGAGPPAKDQS